MTANAAELQKHLAIQLTAIASLLLLSSCAPSVTRPTPDLYKLSVTDNVEARRFEVSLQSNDSRAMCVSVENWPNASGQFPVENNDTMLQVDGDQLSARSNLISAYCPGGCGEHRIDPKGSLQGTISYDAFGDPDRLAMTPSNRLIFPVSPYYCH